MANATGRSLMIMTLILSEYCVANLHVVCAVVVSEAAAPDIGNVVLLQ